MYLQGYLEEHLSLQNKADFQRDNAVLHPFTNLQYERVEDMKLIYAYEELQHTHQVHAYKHQRKVPLC